MLSSENMVGGKALAELSDAFGVTRSGVTRSRAAGLLIIE
jgi:hypothetical protein